MKATFAADFTKPMINQWTLCSEKQPETEGSYWLTVEDRRDGIRHADLYHWTVIEGLGRPDSFWNISANYKAIAWMDAPKPSPYSDPFASEASA